MNLLVHVEQYDVVGILPSQLESLNLVCTLTGVNKAAYIDNTLDGFPNVAGFTRYGSMDEFNAAETGPKVYFSPNKGTDVRDLTVSDDTWIVFGPSMGWGELEADNWAHVPGDTLNSRDAAAIALWELSQWREL